MFRFKGTIIKPNTKTQYWYIQRAHTLGTSRERTQCVHYCTQYCVFTFGLMMVPLN